MRISTMVRLARQGDLRSRVAAMRDGQAAIRVAAVGSGVRSGLLDLVRASPGTEDELAQRGGWSDPALLRALLAVLAAHGLLRERHGVWTLTRRGRRVLADDVVRAAYEGFSGYHTGLYADIGQQLTGGAGRRDVVDQGALIARLSRAMDPFVVDVLSKEVTRRRPRRILDVGCATGSHLAHMLTLLPDASGVGAEIDASAARLARDTLTRSGLAGRARVVEGDVRQVLDPDERFDLVLLANVVYYLPVEERLPLLRLLAERLDPAGAVVVVTTALGNDSFSRHFDLLLRAQEGAMGLPTLDELAVQLRAAGLVPGRPRRIAPGEPLTAVVATRA